MLTLAREPFAQIYPDAGPLLMRHWREIGHYQDIPLDVDVQTYLQCDAAGVLRCFGARINGELIGYSAYFVKPNMHYRGSLQAAQDVLFVAPEHRKSMVGYRLIRFCDDALRDEGVQVVYAHFKKAHSIAPLLRRQNYEPMDEIYAKRLDIRAPRATATLMTLEA